MKKLLKKLWVLLLCAGILAGCGARASDAPDDAQLRIVTTLFPYYDFARAIVGDRADVTLLLSPGREAHSFEPTPQDAETISHADVFVYNGGESEVWVAQMLDAAGEKIGTVLRMMDYVSPLEKGTVYTDSSEEGFGEEAPDAEESRNRDGDGDAIAYDEHIWTSPRNAAILCGALCDALCSADPANAEAYRDNCAAYVAELESLDSSFAALRGRAARDILVFADRMPFLYFCEAYGLRYRAAFPGCSSDTEPSLATLSSLIDLVTEEQIPVVYTVDLDSRKIAETVAEATGAEIETLYSMQTLSRADFDAGETYLTLMERNYQALVRGLDSMGGARWKESAY